MKGCIISLLLLCYVVSISSQSKQDYYWGFGSDQDPLPGLQATEFDFNITPFEPRVRQGSDQALRFDQNNASICDKEGNLLFYTNGCAVANRFHDMMPNGDSINAGVFFEYFWGGNCITGYPGTQDITILPDPGNADGYYIIHKPLEFDTVTFDLFLQFIKYSYIDMSLDGGRGDVIAKNRTFYEGDVVWSYLTSMRHANGEDWWIINPIFPDGYVIFLLDADGIHLDHVVNGPEWNSDGFTSASGDARFSPDGKKYAFFNKYDGLHLYDFDRETGELSGLEQLPFSIPEGARFATCEWSPSSQFLYLIERDTVWQLDTTIEPVEDGLVFIGEYDGGMDPTFSNFKESALGPDCRIYIRPGSSTLSFHVIQYPDEKGIACGFEQRAIRLPYISSVGSFPNFPRFRVDEEDKCDPSIVSAFGEVVYYRRDLITYPNPVSDILTIELPEGVGDGMIYVLDMQGQMVHSQEVSVLTGSMQLSMVSLPGGMYAVEYVPRENKERVVYTSRVTKVE